MPQWEMTIHGRVQGVGFRYFVKESADKWGVKGFVKNLYDGTVYIQAVADIETLEYFSKDVERGNSFSRVRGLNIVKEEITNIYHEFEIK